MRFFSLLFFAGVACGTTMLASIEEMEKLIETEKNLFQVLDDYIKHLDKKTAKIRLYHDEFAKAITRSANGVEAYLDNPINTFLLARRLIVSWNEVEQIMSSDIGHSIAMEIKAKRFFRSIKVPSDLDLQVAALEVRKLQTIYALNATQVANGWGPNGVLLNSGDCFELGKQAYEQNDFTLAQDWLEEALRRVYDERSSEWYIVEYLAASIFLQGSVRKALELTRYLADLQPNNLNVQNNILYYEMKLKEMNENKKKAIKHYEIDIVGWDESDIADLTEKVCTRKISRTPRSNARLRCQYFVDEKKHYLRFASFKLEEVSLRPRIVVFHDFITDNEISNLFQLVYPGPAETQSPVYNGRTLMYPDFYNPRLFSIEQRISDVTGLNLYSSDVTSIFRYSTNGYANTHSLASKTDAFETITRGPVISAFQIFMNDADGGELVFPSVKLLVPAKKGMAVFWHVTHLHGPEETLTRHGICTVKSGDKWVLSKIIRGFYNEFNQPCALGRQPYH